MNLEEIKARAEAAVEPPWKYCGANEKNEDGCDCGLVWGPDGNATVAETNTGVRDKEWKWDRDKVIANGVFIAHAREDVPALIAELERKEKENLSFHAQATGYYEEAVWLRDQLEIEILRRDSLDATLKRDRAELELSRKDNEYLRDEGQAYQRELETQLGDIRRAAEPIIEYVEGEPALIEAQLIFKDLVALAEAIKEEK